MSGTAPIPLRPKASAVEPSRLWRVRLTVSGPAVPATEVADGLHRLCRLSPFLSSARYDERRAQVTYFDEADDLADVAAMALRLWPDNRRDAGLPSWTPSGLEIVDRDCLLASGEHEPRAATTGDVRPF